MNASGVAFESEYEATKRRFRVQPHDLERVLGEAVLPKHLT